MGRHLIGPSRRALLKVSVPLHTCSDMRCRISNAGCSGLKQCFVIAFRAGLLAWIHARRLSALDDK